MKVPGVPGLSPTAGVPGTNVGGVPGVPGVKQMPRSYLAYGIGRGVAIGTSFGCSCAHRTDSATCLLDNSNGCGSVISIGAIDEETVTARQDGQR